MTEFNASAEDDDTFPPAYRELVEPSQPTPKALREWATARGLLVGRRGRISGDVRLAYQEWAAIQK
jgi:hypothetical protein